MGDNAFENMTADLLAMDARAEQQNSVTEAAYEDWKREFTFEGIRGLRYGQSFCNHFDITDYVLYYKMDWASADQHIRTVYLEKF
mgnify:CR=1 FL=1|jgi:hypothetical protein